MSLVSVPFIGASKLAAGRPSFAADVSPPGVLHARILRSPHAHARIAHIDATQARSIPGVTAVLTFEDTPPPSTADRAVLDRTVRFVGDRVAVAAAEDPEVARRACDAARVEYDVLPAVLDAQDALAPDAPVVDDATGAVDADTTSRNIAAGLKAHAGDTSSGFAEAEHVFESEYLIPSLPVTTLEPHGVVTWLDEDQCLVVRSSTAAPFLLRAALSNRLGIPAARIRVLAPRVGSPFAAGADVVTEDLCAWLTLRTGRPVRLDLTREEALASTRASPTQRIHLRAGVRDGRFTALAMRLIAEVGAHGFQAREALRNAGLALSAYRCPHVRFEATAVRTNLPPAVAQVGAGVVFALESQVDEAAQALGEDPVEFRRRNHVQEGDAPAIVSALEAEPPAASWAVAEALRQGVRVIQWSRKRKRPVAGGPLRRGCGMGLAVDFPPGGVEAASLRMNEDGSFTLLAGAAGVGAETVLCRLAAEVLSVPVETVVFGHADTDALPFDSGSPSATAVSGSAVAEAARSLRRRLVDLAARMLGAKAEDVSLSGGRVVATDGRSVKYEDVVRFGLLQREPASLAASASCRTPSAPSSAVAFAEVEVDSDTGAVRVLKIVHAVDGGPADPVLTQAALEGAAVRAVDHALSGRVPHDASGRSLVRSLRDCGLTTAADAPEVVAVRIETGDLPSSSVLRPLGDVATHAAVAAIANAVAQALAVRIRELPLTPERVLAAIGGSACDPI